MDSFYPREIDETALDIGALQSHLRLIAHIQPLVALDDQAQVRLKSTDVERGFIDFARVK